MGGSFHLNLQSQALAQDEGGHNYWQVQVDEREQEDREGRREERADPRERGSERRQHGRQEQHDEVLEEARFAHGVLAGAQGVDESDPLIDQEEQAVQPPDAQHHTGNDQQRVADRDQDAPDEEEQRDLQVVIEAPELFECGRGCRRLLAGSRLLEWHWLAAPLARLRY